MCALGMIEGSSNGDFGCRLHLTIGHAIGECDDFKQILQDLMDKKFMQVGYCESDVSTSDTSPIFHKPLVIHDTKGVTSWHLAHHDLSPHKYQWLPCIKTTRQSHGSMEQKSLWMVSYPNFVRGQLFVGVWTLVDHFEMLNTHRRVICKVSWRFGRKSTKYTKMRGALIKLAVYLASGPI